MKRFWITITIFLTLFNSIHCSAQREVITNDRYLRFSFEGGLFIPVFYGPKDLSLSFPYSIPDANGVPVNYQFNGSLKKAFGTVPNNFGLSSELGYHNHFYAFDFGVSFNQFSGVDRGILFVALGYGHIWSLQRGGLKPATDPNSKRIAISASISGALLNRTEPCGTINDEGVTVNAFGKAITPDFETHEDDNGNSNEVTRHSKEIIVMYSQTGYGLKPQLAISTSPYKAMLHLEYYVSAFIPIFNSSGVKLFQTDGSNDEIAVSSHGLHQDGMTITSGNKTYTQSPFNMYGIQMGIKVGIQGSRHKRKYFIY